MARYLNPSPSAPFLSSLFGYGTTLNKRGGFKLTGPIEGGIFGAPAQANISSYLNLTGANPYTSALGNIGQTGNFLGNLPPELASSYKQAAGTIDTLIGSGTPVVDALIKTGNPVDIGSLVTAAQRRYTNDFLPNAAERYNPAQGTGFQNIAANEATDIATELGQLDYQAQEAARQRQGEAISVLSPTLASLATQRMGLESGALSELGAMSEATDPGARLFSALTALLGFTQQPADLIRKLPTSSSDNSSMWGGLLGSLGQLAGGIGGMCWVADELFGVGSEKAMHARLWCAANRDHPFVQQYAEEGEGWAAWLRDNPWAKKFIAPAWERMAEWGGEIARELN